MKRILSWKPLFAIAAFALSISLCYYVYIGPRLTITAIQRAIEGDEEVSLDGCVDFERFRESLHILFASSIPDSTDESGKLTDTATLIADGMWSAMFLANFSAELDNENASQHFNSWSSYSVVLPQSDEHGYEFVLERYGVSWRLCEVKSY